MNFVTLATITDQTVIITPRYDGQILRLGSDEVVTQAEIPARIYGTGVVEVGEGYWDDLAIVAGDYTGPYFDGDSPGTEIARHRWLGTPNASASVYETRTSIGGNPASDRNLRRLPWIGGQGHSGCRFMGTPTYVTNSGFAGGRIGVAASFIEVGDWSQ